MNPCPIVMQLPPFIAWAIQGNPRDEVLMASVQRELEVRLPVTPNSMVHESDIKICWIGPRSWLMIFAPTVQTSRSWETRAKATSIAANGGALFDVSAARIAYEVSGPMSTELLARHCPLDFDTASFPCGTVAQSLLGRVHTLFIRSDETRFTVMVARSFAADSLRLLLEHAQLD